MDIVTLTQAKQEHIKRIRNKVEYFDAIEWDESEECLAILIDHIKRKGGYLYVHITHSNKSDGYKVYKIVQVETIDGNNVRLKKGDYVILKDIGVSVIDSFTFKHEFTKKVTCMKPNGYAQLVVINTMGCTSLESLKNVKRRRV